MVNKPNRYYTVCRYNTGNRDSCTGKADALIKKLRAVDFSLSDTVLYLDAYPNCKRALDYYHKLQGERAMLTAKLDELGVPMNNLSVSGDKWNWTDAPWPWEYEANANT